MRKLARPDIAASTALVACASSIRNLDLKARLLQIEPAISEGETTYGKHGEEGCLFSLESAENIAGVVTGDEMERVYNNTFVKSVKTRFMYDKIKKSCENDICPLCGQRTVFQLDHFLPISEFPLFGVTPSNLVPACSDCNRLKLAHFPEAAEQQTLHPYFDDVEADRWLFARVVEERPAALTFFVRAPHNWDAVRKERMLTHFNLFGLGALYATHAAVEIGNMRFALTKLSTLADAANAVSEYIREKAESCAAVHANSWQAVTFEALAQSVWFCSGGYSNE